jgi:tRNA U34 2-thiouridine synthase MnmA/TrmU
VGRLEDIVTTTIPLETASLTFARAPLAPGTRAWFQCSAHGTPLAGVLQQDEDGWRVELDEPARPVAAGQSVVFYSADNPVMVDGAAIVR